MNSTIDLIICTYNRPEKVNELIEQIQACSPAPEQIIVVDSSEIKNEKLQHAEGVQYVVSNHKNQPYQRYLGYQLSTSDYILYLDDDMELQDFQFFEKMNGLLVNNDYSGIALNFTDKHAQTTLSEVPKSALFKKMKSWRKLKNWFTGYPDLPEGKFGFCGNRGKQPSLFKETEYLSGGAFIARRKDLFQNFNFQLFDLFEEHMGMGEDGLIGYGLHKRGKLVFLPEIYFLHNDQRDSTYSANLKAFAKKAMFSRLFISMEIQRQNKASLFIAKVHYQWYALWRMVGYFVNYLLHPNKNRKLNLNGSFQGWKKASLFRFAKNKDKNTFWESEVFINLERK